GGLINLAERGVVKVVGGALSEEEGIDGQVILASKAAYDDGLTSPAALAGRSYAVTQPGSSFHYMAHKIAEAEGIATDEVRMVPLQKVGAIVGALKSGQVDAWSIVPNVGVGLSNAPEVEMIGLVSDYIPDYQVTTVFTSTANIDENPDLVSRFLSAFSKGAADFNAALVDKTSGDDDEVVGLIHKYVYTDRPLERAEPAIRAGGMRISQNAALNTTSLQDQLDWFQSQGFVDDSVTLDTFVDAQFVETN
ncbi:MAG: ABC transporter substrate-binding protein, partial [Pseudomonadota bacterium]